MPSSAPSPHPPSGGARFAAPPRPSLPLPLLLLLTALRLRPADAACAGTPLANGVLSGTNPGNPGVGCSGCSGTSTSTFAASCNAGFYMSGATTATCTNAYSCGKNTLIGVCLSCSGSCSSTTTLSTPGTCTACPAGTSNPSTGQTACTGCPAGQYQPSTQQTSCREGNSCVQANARTPQHYRTLNK